MYLMMFPHGACACVNKHVQTLLIWLLGEGAESESELVAREQEQDQSSETNKRTSSEHTVEESKPCMQYSESYICLLLLICD